MYVAIGAGDRDFAGLTFRHNARHFNMQQTVIKRCTLHLYTVRQHERALELPRGNATVQINPAFIVLLPAADGEMIVFQLDIQIIHGKSGHRERDPKPVRARLLDVIRGITIPGIFLQALEFLFNMIETQKKRVIE